MTLQNVKTICFDCHSRCGVILDVEDGRVTGIKGDKDHPFSHGYICPKGKACMEIIYHPDRIRKPLIKMNKKSGRFEEASWDNALGIITEKLLISREKWGAESVVFGTGTTRGLAPYLNRFLALFGSPNFMAPSNMSGGPIVMGSVATVAFGLVDPDYASSKCILLWAHNPEESWPGLYMYDIRQGIKNGAKLIVVDPRGARLAKKADHWLRIRPGTDVALALTFINIIIQNELYDKEFVEKWTTGFDQLKEHVADYTLSRCSEITWLSPEEIEAAALTFAKTKPACIGPGMGGVCQANDAFDLARALTILSAITGNLEVPGGNLKCPPPTHKRSCYGSDYSAYMNLPKEQASKKLGIQEYPLTAYIYIPVPPQCVWPAIEENKPYPVKAVGLFANNSVCAYPNSRRVRNVLSSVDFLLSVDYFYTPTTELADVVLPPAHWSERDDVEDLLMKNYVICQQKAVEPQPDCLNEKQILVDLAAKMGIAGYWKSVKETIDYRLEPIGMKFEEFKKIGKYSVPLTYKSYEKNGMFRTPSGKVELYADYLKGLKISPLPNYSEPAESPLSSPDLLKDDPLILTTGGRNVVCYHSSYRNIPSLKKLSPDPELQINPQTAKELKVENGEWVYLASPRDRSRSKTCYFEDIDPRVVHSPHGYWYGVENGWETLNINILTDDASLCPVTASAPIKALLCRVEKIQ